MMSNMNFRVTGKQVGNGLGTILASIGIPLVFDAVKKLTGRGVRGGASMRIGKGPPRVGRPQPFIGSWKGRGKKKRIGFTTRKEQSIKGYSTRWRHVKDEANLKLPKSFKDVSNLTKPKLKQIYNTLSIDFEKSIGKKALANIVCSALRISTSGPSSKDSQRSSSSYTDIPSLVELEKLKDCQKSLDGVPLVMEESVVKEFLIGAGYNQQAVRKYKTLRAWEHKEGIHSVK